MKIQFDKGNVVAFEQLNPNTVALDGYCQGPALDPEGRRFSFDHHAGCLRMVTKATCEQVREAIILGLPVDEDTTVLINDIDGDTVVAVWLIQNPTRVWEQKVEDLVARIGRTDAHGPIFAPHPIHRELAPVYGSKDPQTLEMLEGFLAKVTSFADGTWQEPAARAERPSKGFGWSPKTGWVDIDTTTGFDAVYKAGYLAGVLFTDAPHGTRMYTVGKRSDLVPLAVGPGAVVRPPKSVEDYRQDTILGALALAELEVNPEQSHATNWGGASSIGGGPRNADGSQSRLSPEQVLAICERFGK